MTAVTANEVGAVEVQRATLRIRKTGRRQSAEHPDGNRVLRIGGITMHLRQNNEMKPVVEMALAYLRGGSFTPQEIDACAKDLMRSKGNGFTYARRILHKLLHDPKEAQKARQSYTTEELAEVRERFALCTYKDKDLPLDRRLPTAFEILQFDGVKLDETASVESLGTASVETLGQAGSIYRQMWEYDLDRQNLHRSYDFFYVGYKKALDAPEKHRVALAWTGINAAYVLDKLAKERAARPSSLLPVGSLKKDAEEIRHTLIKNLTTIVDADLEKRGDNKEDRMPSSDLWWLLSTLGQAHYGLGKDEWEKAKEWFREARQLRLEEDIPTWQVEATSRRIVNSARVHDFDDDPTEVLKAFLGDKAPIVHTIQRGKMGLALSGGGFRASFFHLGVLARLAEQNLLKDVEVISCVSGGSVIGACYYLKLRRLLEKKSDQELDATDYVKLVQDLCGEFLEGIQENLRTRLLSNFGRNLKIVFNKNYTRTDCAGELFEELLFEKVDPDGHSKALRMRDLFISPKREGEEKEFHPRYDNFYRAHKVPILVLNASTLNTGHNWQFTTSWMGEPPGRIDSEIDANERLRRFYFSEIKHDKCKELTLGLAVAASACVPGVFDPVSLSKVYDKRVVRLVDGGVFDNQGIHALLEEDCDSLLISDASGQMNTKKKPEVGFLDVPLRTNEMLMQRVREVQFKELEARRKAGLLKVTFLHLKKDLDARPVSWTGCEEPIDTSAISGGHRKSGEDLTDYQINEGSQRLLADIRTDLDIFNEVEAYALMSNGYRMLQHYNSSEEKGKGKDNTIDWEFLRVTPFLKSADPNTEFSKIIGTASYKGLRFWRLKYPNLFKGKYKRILGSGGALLILLLIFLGIRSKFSLPIEFSLLIVVAGIVAGLATALVFSLSPKRIRDLLLGTFGMLWAKFHLRFIDHRYLERGTIERLEKRR